MFLVFLLVSCRLWWAKGVVGRDSVRLDVVQQLAGFLQEGPGEVECLEGQAGIGGAT